MIGAAPNFMDEIDCSSFFDHIDDLLDFPADDNNNNVDAELTQSDSFPSVWQTQTESTTAASGSVFSVTASDLSAELSVPYEDIVHLEWLSTFCEDSFNGGGLTMVTEKQPTPSVNDKDSSGHNQFQISSPVSVLESSSSCITDKTLPHSPDIVISPTTTTTTGKLGRARSKRPRPATFNSRPAIHLISPSTSSITTQTCVVPKVPSDSESFAESRLVIKMSRHVIPEDKIIKKKKKVRLLIPRDPNDPKALPQHGVRKCMHCEITKTPQWRAGPMGPKTLCNACGVRYKSGRLFPEYRPAASPTFVPSLHSNSHRKVVEMRNNVVVVETPTMMAELIPNNAALGYV